MTRRPQDSGTAYAAFEDCHMPAAAWEEPYRSGLRVAFGKMCTTTSEMAPVKKARLLIVASPFQPSAAPISMRVHVACGQNPVAALVACWPPPTSTPSMYAMTKADPCTRLAGVWNLIEISCHVPSFSG